MIRLLAGGGGTLRVTLYDDAGALDTGIAGISATVTDSAGVEISGSPFAVAELAVPNAGTYAFSPGNVSALDTYDVSWAVSGTPIAYTQFEVVGSFLFSIAALRARYDEITEPKYSAAKIAEIRGEVEDTFTRCARVSFTRRGYREHVHGSGEATVLLSLRKVRRLVAASIDDVALTTDELAGVVVGDGWLERRTGVWGAGLGNVEAFYEHGFASPPGPVVGKALRYARHLLVRSAFDESDRAVLQQTELGTFRMSVAGGSHYTGLPDVDATLEQWGRKLGAVG